MGYSSGKFAQKFFLIQSFSIDLVAYIKRYRSAETTICDKIGTYAEGYNVFFFVAYGSEYQSYDLKTEHLCDIINAI